MKSIKRFIEALAGTLRRRVARRRAMQGATTAAFRIALNGCRL